MDNTSAQSSAAQPADKKTSSSSSAKRKIWLAGTSLLFVVLLAGYLIYWFMVLRYQEYTDDAYVVGLQVPIVAQTTGNVTQVNFENTDLVHAGDVLVVLDKTNAELAYAQARHDLAATVRQTQELYFNRDQLGAVIAQKQVMLNQAQNDYARRSVLGQRGTISKEDLQHSREAVEEAQASLNASVQQLNATKALLKNTALADQPAVLQAADKVRDAWISLQRTEIRSPYTGYVSRRNVQVGAQVSPSASLMAIVPVEPVWIDANFKETQLSSVRIGQPVTITSDFYGDNVIFNGTVAGLDMGTGSAFSLLPAQNATGNWIKVVQRLPVRVELDPQQVAKYPLRIGLSMNVTIETKNTDGPVLANVQRDTPAFKSDVLIPDLAPVNAVIAHIIADNAS
ncbi:TPA: EmrA/EmrK family multidrug efflux transporter periplasmic adaptor subunit [Morganella morganii]|uniref:EmrA/EmrK family multidrug efflux transporter periplasmic adaptor subunit n=1 Tax=Morganella morganii TaxID=582 RepID=A0AAN5MF23_MORMO|nr:EmrA/EmrK family multidrug efflux transporter periplasmic adaptor subunit [Morganella morganii]MCU6273704.1 EmrA/EmrK family multidrug efflux transporter periplasmic adaptor subunit [Morganella morganii]HAT3809038.1 EmrA/EmrK family multidrug efflux transporter periplasmic adaptor subunit [Morganella morganii]HED3890678.1 EmrA/EmrK family multidrug efflux transporter periplasmic adaptor subunit [Morganella morganii]HEI9843474.1 EmrA/EmrK family multidrug efflux transporter periplasmic adapto